MSNYIALVNRLRNRLNEVQLTLVTWNQTVGFDQFTKEAISYAHDDIINAEQEWSFLHQSDTFLTTPGTQLYIPDVTVPTGFNAGPKDIDWEGFYINENTTLVNDFDFYNIATPYQVEVQHIDEYAVDAGVAYSPSLVQFTKVATDPAQGEYTVSNGTYYFSADDDGETALIGYSYKPQTTTSPVTKKWLKPIDYDYWRQNLLSRDANFVGTPDFIFQTQTIGQLGLSPVPDRVYSIFIEYWLAPEGFSSTGDPTDAHVIPPRFENIIIDGALKYCYEFREDAPLAQSADARFQRGIQRMRTELINRTETMKTGFRWQRGSGILW